MSFDLLIVGSGLFGATLARLATDEGYKCLVLDKNSHIAGNCFTRKHGVIDIHEFGPHIFHTSNKKIWDFVNKYATFNSFVNRPKALFSENLYSLPFCLQTFYELWGTKTEKEAKEVINSQRYTGKIHNLEQQALSLVGKDIYETLIKGYTEKQWGRSATDLPAFIIKRLPLRFTFDTNYFNDKYQGIPEEGYTDLFLNLLKDIPIKLNVNYFDSRNFWNEQAPTVVYTGEIDSYFDYCYGKLEYRSLEFEHSVLEDTSNYQGNAIINYTDKETPFTRCIEHKFFSSVSCDYTVITKELPLEHSKGKVPYYPINTEINQEVYKKYSLLAANESNVCFGGRLAEYKYMDMHVVLESAMNKWSTLRKVIRSQSQT
jgi:UDP-galactopyranose mutase